MMHSEQINQTVRDHELAVKWDYQLAAESLHRWFDIFNDAFFDGKLPVAFLGFARTRVTNLGHYQPGRNSVGALHEINLNTRYLDRPLGEVLGTLLHEMIHQWQELFGKPGKGTYHNKQFTAKCAQLGIPCTGGHCSYTQGYTNPFVALLRQHGLDIEERLMPLKSPIARMRPQGSSKLKKWRCACTNVWAGRDGIDLQCGHCGQRLRRAE